MDTKLETLQKEVYNTRCELKGIRRKIEGLRHSHRKDVQHIQTVLSECQRQSASPSVQLKDVEQPTTTASTPMEDEPVGLYPLKPIGYIKSVFQYKNGTPRQANVCQASKAVLTLNKGLFSNPSHSLEGLEEFSHLWVVYVFHKNNNAYSKAKVKPPRLNGARVGLFSTRSPYRPNPIGLSLVRIDKVQGSSVHLSGVDMLDGTPVLDVKPFIPQYDIPQCDPSTDLPPALPKVAEPEPAHPQVSDPESILREPTPAEAGETQQSSPPEIPKEDAASKESSSNGQELSSLGAQLDNKIRIRDLSLSQEEGEQQNVYDISTTAVPRSKPLGPVSQTDTRSAPASNQDTPESSSTERHAPDAPSCGGGHTTVNYAAWLQNPPVAKLEVRFTPTADSQLKRVVADGQCQGQLGSSERLKEAVTSILSADPRSAYRRQQCQDKLYFFVVDGIHLTCWFDECGVAEVLRVQCLQDRKQTIDLYYNQAPDATATQ